MEGPPGCSKQPNDPSGQAGGISADSKEIDAAVLHGRSFTLLTTKAGHGQIAAEQIVFQQTAVLPRLNQDAADFGLGNGPNEAMSTARPGEFLGTTTARANNLTIRPAKPAGFPLCQSWKRLDVPRHRGRERFLDGNTETDGWRNNTMDE